MISSLSNAQIKNVINLLKKSKVRKEQNAFVIEGIKMYEETPKKRLLKTYVSEKFISDSENKKKLQDTEYEVIADDIFKKMSDTVTPQGIMAVVKKSEKTLDEMMSDSGDKMFILLEDIQDPGNLGTILRTAEGAGVNGVIMTKNTVDIYNPKVIRSTMGAIYRVPFMYTDSITDTMKYLQKHNVKLVAAHLKGKNDFYNEDYSGNVGFIIGNEANGITDLTADSADVLVKIPMCGKVESLNASVASAILMYEAFRQHRMK